MSKTDDLIRRYNQEDLLASTLRTTLSLAGPIGAVIGEFLTEFVPGQRVDRLQDFVEQLHDRLKGLEEQFKERLTSSVTFCCVGRAGYSGCRKDAEPATTKATC